MNQKILVINGIGTVAGPAEFAASSEQGARYCSHCCALTGGHCGAASEKSAGMFFLQSFRHRNRSNMIILLTTLWFCFLARVEASFSSFLRSGRMV